MILCLFSASVVFKLTVDIKHCVTLLLCEAGHIDNEILLFLCVSHVLYDFQEQEYEREREREQSLLFDDQSSRNRESPIEYSSS